MDDAALKTELETLYTRMREGFATYDFEKIRASIPVPEGEPMPDRGYAQQLASFLPDLARGEFLKIEREGDWIGYYLAEEEPDGTRGVTVIRFLERDGAIRLAPGPHTMHSYSSDEGTPEEWLQTREDLKLVPEDEGDGEMPPPPPAPEGADLRPEAEVREELERVWASIRDAFARGAPEDALPHLDVPDASGMPPASEAPRILEDLPDFSESEFLKIGFSPAKPMVAGYYASTGLDDPDESTIDLVVFVRRDGRWRYAPGPGSIEQRKVAKTDRAGLLRLLETDPALSI